MKNGARKFKVLERYVDVAQFVAEASEAADSDRNALGFFPASAFAELARKEQLFVVVEQHDGVAKYAGHLLFYSRHPKAHVLQVFVARDFRKQGLAALLLDRLKSHLTEHAFISVYARVAEELIEANAFWQKQDFYVQRMVRGGASRGRTILVRCHELATPQLFASSGLSAANPLGLGATSDTAVPLYLLDLNVLFDLGPRRARNEEVLDLFRAERLGACQLALSTEISAELTRTATAAGKTDPMQAYARIFPTFQTPSTAEWDSLSQELGQIVFPERHRAGTLTSNDASDLRHLATAIHHRLAGFITNDASILAAATQLQERCDIQVVSPTAFKEASSLAPQGEVFETASEEAISLMTVTATDEAAVRTFLSRLGSPSSQLARSWGAIDLNDRVCTRHGVWCDGTLLGYMVSPKWVAGVGVTARLAVDESHPNSLVAARALLGHLIDQAASKGAVQVRVELPLHQVQLREVAASMGFGGLADQASLTKLVLNSIVTTVSWDQCRSELISAGRLRLPDAAPPFRSVDQQLQMHRPDGYKVHVSLMALESLLAPALFCLPGRHAVITPVRRVFAEQLLAHSPQRSLLPHARATLYQEKHYVSGERTLKHFKRGGVILFYESGRDQGVGAVVAVGRIQHAYLKSQEAMDAADLDPSVLDEAGLEAIGRSKRKTVTVFDNVIRLPRRVPLATLQRLGCGSPTDLVTTHPIDDSQLQQILCEGQVHA